MWHALLDKATDIAALYNINPNIAPAATPWKRRGGYFFRLLEESSLLPISGSPCIESQRAVSETLPGFQAQHLIPGSCLFS